MYVEYVRALTLGQKELRACHAKGIPPYLPVLDDLLAGTESCGEVNLGLTDVPIELVVGTKSAGRQRAFTRSFLPLLEEDSEFAAKWVSLCQAHLSEGIRDPVQLYEYLHCFYVKEGHKRVSVLRYFGAVTIPATVTRILPAKNDSPESRIYYEFLDFWQRSGINFLWFGREGSFARFQAAMGKREDETWSPEERRDFFSFYLRFSAACEFKGPVQACAAAVGDSILMALSQWDYPQLRDCPEGELKARAVKVKEALAAQIRAACEADPAKKSALQLLIQPIKVVTTPMRAMLGREDQHGAAEGPAPDKAPPAPAGEEPPEAPDPLPSPQETTAEKGCENHADTCHLGY